MGKTAPGQRLSSLEQPTHEPQAQDEAVGGQSRMQRAQETPRPIRTSKHPARFNDYLCYSARPHGSTNSSVATSLQKISSCTRYPIANYLSCEKFTVSHKILKRLYKVSGA